MGRLLLNSFPTWMLFIIVAILMVGFAATVRYIGNRYFYQYLIRKQDNISLYISMLVTGLAIFLAFTVIVLWQSYTATTQYVSQEANSLAKIILDSRALPLNDQAVIEKGIKNYITIVRNEEWPLMRLGERSTKAQDAFENLYLLLSNMSPTTDKEKLYHQEILLNLNNALEGRRLRLERVESNMPFSIVSVIIISSLSLISLLALLEEKPHRIARGLVYVLSCILALYLSLILLLDYPYSGNIAVSNKPFVQGVLGKI